MGGRWGRWGYWAGYRAGDTAGRDAGDARFRLVCEEYERQLATAHARLKLLEACERAAVTRADVLMDKLLASMGVRALSDAGRAQLSAVDLASRNFSDSLTASPFDELPFGDARGTFKRAEDALLDPDAREPEDDDGSE